MSKTGNVINLDMWPVSILQTRSRFLITPIKGKMMSPLKFTVELFMKVLISYICWLRNKVLKCIYNFCKILRFLGDLLKQAQKTPFGNLSSSSFLVNLDHPSPQKSEYWNLAIDHNYGLQLPRNFTYQNRNIVKWSKTKTKQT